MDITQIFESRKNNSKWNTSYPLSPNDWVKYRTDTSLIFNEKDGISYYIHIPFCKKLCSFCEYTRMECPSIELQYNYLVNLEKDVLHFVHTHANMPLRGFDIGGGTPTTLSEENFQFLLNIFRKVIDRLSRNDDFEPSIETTFDTITLNKARMITEAGIRRVSLGIQSTDPNVLKDNHRVTVNLTSMLETIEMLHHAGIEKVNLDLMYGLKGQTTKSIAKDLKAIEILNQEQVTLYELRTNMIREPSYLSKDELYYAYRCLYEGLIALGYHARFGQNTFSKYIADHGVSSYLRSRMLDGVAYKGFGLSAQSMNNEGISYNIGKNSCQLKKLLSSSSFLDEYIYKLPPAELASKYIAIGAYNGSFSLNHVTKLIGQSAIDYFKKQLDFCLANDLVSVENERVYITANGFRHYGAVFSLFYSNSL